MLKLQGFQQHFKLLGYSEDQRTSITARVVSILQGGAFIGTSDLRPAPTSDAYVPLTARRHARWSTQRTHRAQIRIAGQPLWTFFGQADLMQLMQIVSVIFLVGAGVQTAGNHELAYIYGMSGPAVIIPTSNFVAGRFVAGLGVGAMTMIAP